MPLESPPYPTHPSPFFFSTSLPSNFREPSSSLSVTAMAVRSTAPLLHHFFASTTTTSLIPHSRYSLFNSSPHFLSLSSSSVTRVATTPVELGAQAPELDLEIEIARLKAIRSRLGSCESLRQRLKVVGDDSRVKRFFESHRHGLARVLASLNLDSYELFLIKCLVAAGQEHVLASSGLELEASELETARSSVKSAFYALVEMIEGWDGNGKVVEKEKKRRACLKDEEVGDLRRMLKTLREIEEFYNCIGGIIGYQIKVLELLPQSSSERQTSHHAHELMESQFLEIHAPSGFDLSQNTEYASQAALWGIEGLPGLGEIYPLGGSADRLGLVDPDTGECLPAAMLPYCGRTLLEGLIRDLQAREFLYFKMYGKQCITPVAIMTSSAKNNHEHITSLCARLNWFGRGQSSFQFFEQPLVPTVSAEDGEWVVAKPFSPVCKPGGHGVLWKLAYDKGIFQWFYRHGRKGATVRQVSNVVAATDLTLLALAGIGLHHGKKLGFASCKRNLGATEGIDVLVEKKNADGKWAYGLSCIEYTEFDKFGITDGPLNSLQADFPANTNILYVDLPSAELVASSNTENCLPGLVLNIKKPVVYKDHLGYSHSVPGGRLECTMQNIADNFLNTYNSRCYRDIEDKLDTYIVYNERRRVTSSAKKRRQHASKSLHQTPDGSLLDILRNACDLLSKCDIKIPKVAENNQYVDSGPPFLILLHPALGPLWEITRQKFYGGYISEGSELQIEIAEFLWRDVQLDGSLIIVAENAIGSSRIEENGEHTLQYGLRCGRCKLQKVKVLNKGINWSSGNNVYWKHHVQRFEELRIILHGNAEFEATDVTIQGNHVYEVPDGHRLKITSGNSGIKAQLDPIEEKMTNNGSWYWNYKIKDAHIQLELVEL